MREEGGEGGRRGREKREKGDMKGGGEKEKVREEGKKYAMRAQIHRAS